MASSYGKHLKYKVTVPSTYMAIYNISTLLHKLNKIKAVLCELISSINSKNTSDVKALKW